MRGAFKIVLTAGLTLLLSLALVGPASAYPRADGWWSCGFPLGELVLEQHRDRYYDMNKMSRDGRYAYNRDKGRVTFRTGYLDDYYGKFDKQVTGWYLVIRKKGATNSSPPSVCQKSGG